jgi:transposase
MIFARVKAFGRVRNASHNWISFLGEGRGWLAAVPCLGRRRLLPKNKGLRYESDLTDEEFALIEPFLPPERSVSRRSLVNGILYLLTTGCQWRQLPKDFPPKSTTHDYYVELLCSGTLTRIHHALYAEVRSLEGRAATPTLAIVDSQTVKSAEKGGQTLIRPVMMRARKSKAKSATPLWIRSVS